MGKDFNYYYQYSLGTTVVATITSMKEYYDMREWCKNNISDRYHFSHDHRDEDNWTDLLTVNPPHIELEIMINFRLKKDALLFYMTFGGEIEY